MIIHGNLRFLVLRFLTAHDMSGYELMNQIKLTVGKKPSPGSMYPLLDSLVKEKLTSVSEKDRKKIYKITAKGRTEFKKLLSTTESLVSEHETIVKKITKTGITPSLIMKGIKFSKDFPEMVSFKKTMFNLMDEDKLYKNKAKVKEIIKNATKELKKL